LAEARCLTKTMGVRLIILAMLCWPATCAAQITGRFFLEKETYAAGEPVLLYFEVINIGSEAVNIPVADPYSFCSGYGIQVSSDPKPASSCASGGIVGSCLSSDTALKPGEKRIERILLNDEHDVRTPGTYVVEAERSLGYAPTSVNYFEAAKSEVEVREKLLFRVDADASVDEASLQAWVQQLKSDDEAKRREAARVLAALAPPSLEELLLGFCDSPEFRMWAPRAMHGLNTPRSLQALADLLKKTEPGTYEHMKSADFLAETGDAKWFPMLREVAEKKPNIANYVDNAASSGGEQSLPLLLTLMQSPDKEFTRINAVTALGYTGSRAAVPILLHLLRGDDLDIAQRALFALRQLTHRTEDDAMWSEHPQEHYAKWATWWSREGSTAPIYKASECGEFKPLQ
jgi:HEAT repeats